MTTVLLAALLATGTRAQAQLRPHADWRTFESPHFRIVFETPLEPLARHAAQRAEVAYARLAAGLITPPAGRIDLILADNTDLTNGAATPFPSNRIFVWVRPPVEDLSLQFYNDWIDLVIVHELTHIFHMDRAGAVGRALRKVFGRVPFGWPFFPVIGTPDWSLEGLATLQESRYTGAGRVHGSYHEMIVRTAVLENRFDPIDRVSGETPIWPGGTRAYIYGSLFMDYIARRYGPRVHGELIRATAGSILPPGWRMDGIAKKVTGRSFSDLYREWQDELRARYGVLADSLRQSGLTTGEQLTSAGRWALHPRASLDGRLLAFTEEDGRSVTRTRVLRLQRDAREASLLEDAFAFSSTQRRNGLGPVSWLPDGSFLTAQYEFSGPYSIYSDLYRVSDGDERRLTRALRIETPHAAADGRRVIGVVNEAGGNYLVVLDLMTRTTRAFTKPRADAHWILPRWSPDGARIAVQRWRPGGTHDIVVIDTLGNTVRQITADAAVDAAPAWSPDGRYVVFSSDRTGIPNLYAADLFSDPVRVRQVSNVLSGAFYPEVSSDGWLYYSAYHADGFYIERLPFDPALWRDAPGTVRLASSGRPMTVTDTVSPAPDRVAPDTQRASSQYSPFPSLLPRFWLPVFYGDTALGAFIGAATVGTDDVNRHTYVAQLAYEPDDGRLAGYLSYAYAGLGNPVIGLEVEREWDYTGRVDLRDSAGNIVATAGSYEREDRVALTTTLTHRHWRWATALLLGAEGVVLSRGILGAARFRDPEDRYAGVLAGFAFSNTRSPALAISPEDGLRTTFFVRRRFDVEPDTSRDATYTDLNGNGAVYKSIDLFGFAHHVLAARGSIVHRRGLAAGPTDVGGVVDFLPVRGFQDGDRIGFTAWSASLEYRVPLALIGRGYRLRPLFIDRMSISAFLDGGNASCTTDEAAVFRSCPGVDANPTAPLLSLGGEVNAHVAVLAFVPLWLRGGIAFPLQGGRSAARAYMAVGRGF